MSYVDDNLMSGERVVYRARLHNIVYAWVVVFVVLGLITMLASAGAAVFFFLIAGAAPALCYLRVKTSEFAVTNRRVLVKVGILSRRSLEILLAKIEGIGVNQGITAKMLDYGTIVITGTGGTKEPFKQIANPLTFRKQVQEQIGVAQNVAPVAAR